MALFSGPPAELYRSAAALLGGGGFMLWVGILRARLDGPARDAPARAADARGRPFRRGDARRWYAAAAGLCGILTGAAFLLAAILASASAGAFSTSH